MEKNRHSFGERHGQAKLSVWDVLLVREFCRFFYQYEVAKIFGISRSQVSAIYRRKQWSHVAES